LVLWSHQFVEARLFMAEAQAGNPVARAVVLSPDGSTLLTAGGPALLTAGGDVALECAFVATAYEAAAELIAAPALAIVIDLRMMGPRHLRLLRLARERRVEMLAVGSIPPGLTAEDLSGVRLLARAEVKAELQKLLRDFLQDREGRYEPSAPPAASAVETNHGDLSRQSTATPAAKPESQRSELPSPQAIKQPATAPKPESPSSPSSDSLRGILTAGELAALLEERS
jgi:hypothetical protein